MGEGDLLTAVERWLEFSAVIVDLVGVVVVLIGFGVGAVGFVMASIKSHHRADQYAAIQHARCSLGSYLLFGLELMIVSDVLRTVLSHTLEDLSALGLLVVIRTLIAYFLGREIAEIRAHEQKTPG